MAKDSLKDNNVAQNAFTEAKSPFGWNKEANDILDNEAGTPSHQRIQEVAATLQHKGKPYEGKLGNMQPKVAPKAAPPQVEAKPEAVPE